MGTKTNEAIKKTKSFTLHSCKVVSHVNKPTKDTIKSIRYKTIIEIYPHLDFFNIKNAATNLTAKHIKATTSKTDEFLIIAVSNNVFPNAEI